MCNSDSQFYCGGDKCIPKQHMCDGINDCSEGEVRPLTTWLNAVYQYYTYTYLTKHTYYIMERLSMLVKCMYSLTWWFYSYVLSILLHVEFMYWNICQLWCYFVLRLRVKSKIISEPSIMQRVTMQLWYNIQTELMLNAILSMFRMSWWRCVASTSALRRMEGVSTYVSTLLKHITVSANQATDSPGSSTVKVSTHSPLHVHPTSNGSIEYRFLLSFIL